MAFHVVSQGLRPCHPFGTCSLLLDTLYVPIRIIVHTINKGFRGNPKLDFSLVPSELCQFEIDVRINASFLGTRSLNGLDLGVAYITSVQGAFARAQSHGHSWLPERPRDIIEVHAQWRREMGFGELITVYHIKQLAQSHTGRART